MNRTPLALSIRREQRAWRLWILQLFAQMREIWMVEENPNQGFRRREFLHRIRMCKEKGRSE